MPPTGRVGGAVLHDRTEAPRSASNDATLDPLARPELIEFLAPPEKPGEIGRLGPYRVVRVMGAGGMGVVYHAEDTQLQRPVALKALLPALAGSAEAKQRFLREARAAAAIKHDHIVTIYQVGEDRGAPYLAMEFLHGESLEDRLRRLGRPPLAEMLRIGREVAEGLAAAHERGLIHRDIKPGNLWLEDRSAGGTPLATGGRVKVLDFGLARASGDATQLTQQGAILGTPAYMAPEQAAGAALDPRCDLFSLGCVLYRLTTGQLPFQGADIVSTLVAVATEQPRPPAELNPDLPPEVAALILKLLAKKPEERPASARAVVQALAASEAKLTKPLPRRRPAAAPAAPVARTEKLPQPKPVPQSKPAPPPRRRGRGLLVVGTVVLLVALLGGGTVAALHFLPTLGGGEEPGPRSTSVAELEQEPPPPPPSAWVALFDGKNTSGWKTFDKDGSKWEVQDGVLVGRKGPGYLFSNRGDYENFHFRVEAKINPGGNSGQFFRAQFGPGVPVGYEAQINATHSDLVKTGSLHPSYDPTLLPEERRKIVMHRQLHKPNEWFTQEVIADGNHIVIKVNDETTVDFVDRKNTHMRGYFALQVLDERTVVHFRKVEVRELPPTRKGTTGGGGRTGRGGGGGTPSGGGSGGPRPPTGGGGAAGPG
jgi:serine/threonine protein kinase